MHVMSYLKLNRYAEMKLINLASIAILHKIMLTQNHAVAADTDS
jgi:hypothetical protein